MKLLVLLLVVVSSLEIGAFAQTDIDLGPADHFAVLGASGITNVSAHTFIIGDVGSFPTPSVTGLTKSQVDGRLYLKASYATSHAQTGLTVAYNQAANAPCENDLTGKDLGGLTLGPGVYCFSSSAGLTGTLTLDANGNTNAQWIFQIGSTLTAASNSTVDIVLGHRTRGDGPQPLWKQGLEGCNVYWQVGSSATIGTGSIFRGKILALTSITLNGGTLHGKALASNGAVTMSARETVNGPPCGAGT
ncbi:MAG: ice-binding family protein [Terriglobales bacterium]|jgi:ice-binding like protein